MDQKATLAEYKDLRNHSIALSEDLVKTLSREDIDTAARRLGMLTRGTIELETEDEIAVLMDYAIHEVYRDGANAVARMLRDNPPPEGSAKLRLLHSLKESRYTLVEIERAIPGFGLIGLEGVSRTPVTIVDVNLSRTAQLGLSMATRLQSPGDGWSMTTGTTLPMTLRALTGMISAMESYSRRHGHEPSGADRTTLIVRECIKARVSQRVSYADPGAELRPTRAAAPIRAGDKIGRNDPCPCGSRKKYKKCCGT